LRECRTDAGISQTELARLLDRPQTWVSKVELGERRLDVDELRQMCAALDLDLVKLVAKWLRVVKKGG
jgi:transcriptional regulator with XRE-family HTH domain